MYNLLTDSVSLCKYIDVKIKFTKFTISKMLEENQYCKEIKNKQLKKEPIMTKDNIRHFQMVNKCHVCNMLSTEKDIKLRDHCHTAGKCKGSTHHTWNTN